MPGTIFRLRDDSRLQRGITYTILPDGKSLRVPDMHRMNVRAAADSHEKDQHGEIMQALTDLLKGKKPVPGRARYNRHGQAHGHRIQHDPGKGRVRGGPPAHNPNEGLRQANMPVEA